MAIHDKPFGACRLAQRPSSCRSHQQPRPHAIAMHSTAGSSTSPPCQGGRPQTPVIPVTQFGTSVTVAAGEHLLAGGAAGSSNDCVTGGLGDSERISRRLQSCRGAWQIFFALGNGDVRIL